MVAIYKSNHSWNAIHFFSLQCLSMSLTQHNGLKSYSKKQRGHSSTVKEEPNQKEEKKLNCCIIKECRGIFYEPKTNKKKEISW